MKTKWVAILAVAVLLLSAGAVFGQPGPGRGQGPGPAQGPAAGDRIARFLGLTADQLAQWNAIHEEMRAAVAPLREQRLANREAIQDELELPTPNAIRIGELVIANHALRQQQIELREQTHAKLMNILTPEQQQKFQQMLERRGNRRGGFGDGRGPGQGDGLGFCG